MSSKTIFSSLYEQMRYAHGIHGQQLLSMQQQCKQIKTIADLHRLASDMHTFSYYLHLHHTIEDQGLFPKIARKTDISHLEAHHAQLSQILIEFNNLSSRLKQLKTLDDNTRTVIIDATELVDRVSKLVNEHERAEEQVISPDNMRKLFTESEMKQLLNF
ncbi:unnamed protein product [Adineta steineri]|uniref:Hemerythrin-like domain-containing protein n=1 Tax=Adineta steineri TaxID=433720 RepID=A0A818X555_9BILA|nr:unnamed protein product [Adineta steineri]CAF3735214.1 unnamed protein product [Adineta steineri]